jgi:acyl carrier protein
MTPDILRAVLEPKALGGWNLHQLTLDDPLEWFALFSSAAGVLGSPGQANYSAANACLDSLAHHRRHLGRPAVAIDWGPWAEVGMAAEMDESGEGRRLRTAASAITPSDGLAAFESLMCGDRVQTLVLPFDLRDLLQFYPAGVGLSFFDEVSTEDVAALKSIGVRSSARPDLEREYVAPRNAIERQIVSIWQKSLAIEPIGVLDSFFELGGDSVFGNQILVEINRSLGVSIDPERAFQKLTVAHLAELAEEQVIAHLNKMTDQDAERTLKELQATSNPVSQ